MSVTLKQITKSPLFRQRPDQNKIMFALFLRRLICWFVVPTYLIFFTTLYFLEIGFDMDERKPFLYSTLIFLLVMLPSVLYYLLASGKERLRTVQTDFRKLGRLLGCTETRLLIMPGDLLRIETTKELLRQAKRCRDVEREIQSVIDEIPDRPTNPTLDELTTQRYERAKKPLCDLYACALSWGIIKDTGYAEYFDAVADGLT